MSLTQTIDPALLQLFEKANADISASLPDPKTIDVERARRILARYCAAFEGNFTSWMGAAVVSARSHAGRYAASENLMVEIRDDHPTMLRQFVRHAGATPTVEDQADICMALENYRGLFARMSGLRNLSAMAVLEGSSSKFIPWLGELAKKSGGRSFKYVEVHGEVDVEHAKQFLWAVGAEIEHWSAEQALQEIQIGIGITVQFLHFLFNGSRRP